MTRSRSETPRRSMPFPVLVAAVAMDGRPKYKIAADAGLPPNVLGGILHGRTQPNLGHRLRLARELGRTADDLFATATTISDYARQCVAETCAAQGVIVEPDPEILEAAGALLALDRDWKRNATE